MLKSAVTLCLLVAAAGCHGDTSGNTKVACQPLSEQPPGAPLPAFGGTVFTIVMENKGVDEIIGNSDAPFINQLAKDYAIARGYHDPFIHPSEPNYIWMVAGQNFGILDDDDPKSHSIDATSHLADQLEQAGISWKSYQESMGAPCGVTSHKPYAAKHDPFVYFSNINGWDGKTFQPSERCDTHIVDFSELDKDIAANTVPRYAFITPNLDNDMHDGSIAQGDAWLRTQITKIMATDAYKNGGVIFLTWDEGGGSIPGDDPPFIVISPHAKRGYVSTVDYDTSSFLVTVQSIFGLQPLPCADQTAAASVSAMTDLFDVPLTTQP